MKNVKMIDKLELTKKKLIMTANILQSEEYKKADELMKKVNKLKEDVKNYCQHNRLTELKAEEDGKTFKVDYKIRTQKRADPKLLPPEILDEITATYDVWLQFYTIE